MRCPLADRSSYHSSYSNHCLRLKILNLPDKFHVGSHLYPADFTERNVVVRNGKYRLIDFHSFEGRECDCRKAATGEEE